MDPTPSPEPPQFSRAGEFAQALPVDESTSHEGSSPPDVTLDNGLKDQDTLRYPLALLSGRVGWDTSHICVRVVNGSKEEEDGHSIDWPVREGRFKALAPLKPGKNRVLICSPQTPPWSIEFFYWPQGNPFFVRVVYLLSADGDGSFDSPETAVDHTHDCSSAVCRLKLNMRLLQTFVAESMHRQEGLGRKTFRLEEDDQGQVLVHVRQSSRTTEEWHQTKTEQLWGLIGEEVRNMDRYEKSVTVVIMGFSHYDAESKVGFAHTAVGGGHLALFSNLGLHSWAASLEEVSARFTDSRELPETVHDDSNSRGTFWALYSTTLGATLHEMGHCFSLSHTRNRKGIMFRDFDHINRIFVPWEPPSAGPRGGLPLIDQQRDEVGWHRSSAVRLCYHRHFWLDDRGDVSARTFVPNTDLALTIGVSDDGEYVIIRAPRGMRHVDYRIQGEVDHHMEYLGNQITEEVQIPFKDLQSLYPEEKEILVTAEDDTGAIVEEKIGLVSLQAQLK